LKDLITHMDLFSGPGGICTGFRAAGIKTVLAIEKIKSCVDTYSANHPDVTIINDDIRNINETDITRAKIKKIDVITSGMPCETFSTAGSKSRSFYDHRQQLYFETIRIADILKPKLILFENVPGILSKKVVKGEKRLIIEDIFDDLSNIGYKYYVQTTLLASDFGVPQHRQRYFILASNNPNLDLTVPISKHNGTVTVTDAFIDLPKVEANREYKNQSYLKKQSPYTKLLKNAGFWGVKIQTAKLTYHEPPNHRLNTLRRFKLIRPGENLKSLFLKHTPEEVEILQEKKVLPKKWFIQRNMRLIGNRPSKTVTSHCLDELIHPNLDRCLTIREIARLQSFPDHYDFAGGPTICPHIYETQDKYEQIGDAVPPLLAYHWGETIKKILGV
jgi:DNA (cytosine-5)-methyltransferase 1